ncbi:MAG TPA: FAD-dependent oxidoreductase [Candidatus Brocadiia bacterium]|nr:FAD-dependent oxidoreductase [Candidatus Brocadiia bacterium]
MKIRVHDITLGLDDDPASLPSRAAERIGLPSARAAGWRIARRAIETRGPQPVFVYAVDLEVDPAAAPRLGASAHAVADPRPFEAPPGAEPLRGRVAVIGCGPAGLAATLRLAEQGYRPLLLERGLPVAERCGAAARFLRSGQLDPECNLLYGAGGCCLFSAGRLRASPGLPRVTETLRRFVEAGGPEEILYDTRPWVGSDRLRAVIESLCRLCLARGAEICWNTRVDAIDAAGGQVRAVHTSNGIFETGVLIAAPGPNARDTVTTLLRAGVRIEARAFRMGLRIEHTQDFIDHAVYGASAGHPALGAAEYFLASRGPRPVSIAYPCPGGSLLPIAAEPLTLGVSGGASYARDSGRCNAALVTPVSPEEAGGSPLAGLALLRHFEEVAYVQGGGGYRVPAQNAADFLKGVVGPLQSESACGCGLRPADLSSILPPHAAGAIARALREFEQRIPGFTSQGALLTGPESHASCPIRVPRDPNTRQSVSVNGLYPAGAGSGHACGIVSSFVDGLLAAEAVIRRFRPPA